LPNEHSEVLINSIKASESRRQTGKQTHTYSGESLRKGAGDK